MHHSIVPIFTPVTLTDPDDEQGYQWQEPNGRHFFVRELSMPGRNFLLEEMLPAQSGHIYQNGCYRQDPALSPKIQALAKEGAPSKFYEGLAALGVAAEDLAYSSAGVGWGAILYGSMGEARAMVREAMRKDVWYQQRMSASPEHRLSSEVIQEARESRDQVEWKLGPLGPRDSRNNNSYQEK